jgi:hypothetical protein
MGFTVYSNTSDGYQASGLISTWDATHDAVGFGSPTTSTTRTSTNGIRYEYVTGRASGYYLLRSFFDFDTSGITSTVASATFSVKTYSQNSATPIVVCKSGHDPSTTSDDWFSTWLTGQSITLSGWSTGDVTKYSTHLGTTVASNGNFTNVTLNAAALSDLVSLSSFKICVLHANDLADTAPSSITRTGFYFADYSGTGSDPQIGYELSTGYGHDVIGVASANIGSINGVAVANIEKVNGV